MGQIIDTCVWIDYLRASTPTEVRQRANAVINDSTALLCEMVRFELAQGTSLRERVLLKQQLDTMPTLPTPPSLWVNACHLAEVTCDARLKIPSMDLLLAALCIHHNVALTTFDTHFTGLAKVTKLKVNLLPRP